VYDENEWIPWFTEKMLSERIPGIAPLGYLLRPGPPRRASTLTSPGRSTFLYAQLGDDDLLAFPDLVPGSIVRVDPSRGAERLPEAAGPSREIFLVYYDSTLHCGRLQRNAKGRIVLCSVKFPFVRFELNSDSDFRICGVVNAEMRPLNRSNVSCPVPAFANSPSQRELRRTSSRAPVGELIRLSRLRAGFSFREASALSRPIAEAVGDEMYFTAVGTLSEYETLAYLPRHVQKIISICILYNIRFWELLTASGIRVDPRAGHFMPNELIPRGIYDTDASVDDALPEHTEDGHGFLARLVAEWSDIPLFAKDAFAFAAGLKDLSLSDVFWVGGDRSPIHPYLVHATFVSVNRRVKKPTQTAKTLWEQPLYMVLKRDGGFLCGACTLEHGHLLIHPYPDRPSVLRQLRNGIDAEVIGQVTAVVRRLD
jgi:hypothetical protein